MIVIDLVTVTEIGVAIAIVVAVIMEVGGDLVVVETALTVVSQDTLPENALVKGVEVVGMVAEVVVVEAVAMDPIGTEIDMEAAAAEMVVVVEEVNGLAVIALGHTNVAVLEALELADALSCAEELEVLPAGCK